MAERIVGVIECPRCGDQIMLHDEPKVLCQTCDTRVTVDVKDGVVRVVNFF